MPSTNMTYSQAMYSFYRQDVSTASEPDVSWQKYSRLPTSRTVFMTSTAETRTVTCVNCIQNFTVSDDSRTHYEPRKDEPVELVSCPYFTTSVYNLTETMNMDYSELDSFVIYICMKGACTITDNEGNRISVKAGESVLFPATTQNLEVVPEGEVSFLETYL